MIMTRGLDGERPQNCPKLVERQSWTHIHTHIHTYTYTYIVCMYVGTQSVCPNEQHESWQLAAQPDKVARARAGARDRGSCAAASGQKPKTKVGQTINKPSIQLFPPHSPCTALAVTLQLAISAYSHLTAKSIKNIATTILFEIINNKHIYGQPYVHMYVCDQGMLCEFQMIMSMMMGVMRVAPVKRRL